MKLRPLFARLAVLGLVTLLASCTATGTGTRTSLDRNPDRLGRRAGLEDALAGRSSNYERRLAELHPSADHGQFQEAYNDAYAKAEAKPEQYVDASGYAYGKS